MKSLITAMALMIATPCLALPANPQAAGNDPVVNAQGNEASVVTPAQFRRHHYRGYRRGMGARDPDRFIREYLREDPPGRHWGNS
jgi:hypothetical protein